MLDFVKILTKLLFLFFHLFVFLQNDWFLKLAKSVIQVLSLTLISRLCEQIAVAGVIPGLGNKTNCWVIDLLFPSLEMMA